VIPAIAAAPIQQLAPTSKQKNESEDD